MNVCNLIAQFTRECVHKTNSDEEDALDVVRLQEMARDERLWLAVLSRLIDTVALTDPLGASVCAIFVQDTPIPSAVTTTITQMPFSY